MSAINSHYSPSFSQPSFRVCGSNPKTIRGDRPRAKQAALLAFDEAVDEELGFYDQLQELLETCIDGDSMETKDLKALVTDYLNLITEDIDLPILGPWSVLKPSTKINRERLEHNREVLNCFCDEVNRIVRVAAGILEEEQVALFLDEVIDDYFVRLMSSLETEGLNDDLESDFSCLVGRVRNPNYLFWSEIECAVIGSDDFNYFQEADIKKLDDKTLDDLSNQIFASLDIDLKQQPWLCALVDNIGIGDEVAFYDSEKQTIPTLSKESLDIAHAVYGQYFDERAYAVHETAHKILEMFGYGNDRYRSFPGKLNQSHIHELIAFTAELQVAPIQAMFELLSVGGQSLEGSCNEYLYRDFVGLVNKFFARTGNSFEGVFADLIKFFDDEGEIKEVAKPNGKKKKVFQEHQLTEPGLVEHKKRLYKEKFDIFISRLKEAVANDLHGFEDFIKAKFLTKARYMVAKLQSRGEFDEAEIEEFRNTVYLNRKL